MSDGPYFTRLKQLVESGRLSVHIIIAPPRTNSSLVEHMMGNSPDIHHECHEPFLKARQPDFDPDHGYRQIYESIGGEVFEQSGGTTSVAVKEMSHWIAKNHEYRRLATLTRHPIVALIRNPLLSVESRIRRVLSTMDMRSSLDLQRYLLDHSAAEKGFANWSALVEAVRSGVYTSPLDFVQNGENLERLYGTPVLTIQNELLNSIARRNGYVNWRDLIERKLYTERDYVFFEGILRANPRRLGFEREEFKKLAEAVEYFEGHGHECVVFDTTDIRIAPDEQMRELCARVGIVFSPEMLEWQTTPVDFHTEQTQEFEKLWYDTLFSSSKVKPPTEIPPVLKMFPRFVRHYLRTNNLPIYAELARKKVLRSDLRHELNNRELRIPSATNPELFRRLGVITDETGGEEAVVPLKYVDPIYAVTNEPKLVRDPEFQRMKGAYGGELKIVSDIGLQQDEHVRSGNGVAARSV